MLTTSHAIFTYGLVPAGGATLPAVIGSLLPDVPFLVATPWHALRGRPLREAIGAATGGPVSGRLARAAHSFVVWAAAAALGLLLLPSLAPLVWGWLGHNAADFFTHHTEAHSHFYPLSDWRFASPVSYYERDHHAVAYTIGEAAAAATVLAARFGYASFLAGIAAPAPIVAAAGLAGVVALVARYWRPFGGCEG